MSGKGTNKRNWGGGSSTHPLGMFHNRGWIRTIDPEKIQCDRRKAKGHQLSFTLPSDDDLTTTSLSGTKTSYNSKFTLVSVQQAPFLLPHRFEHWQSCDTVVRKHVYWNHTWYSSLVRVQRGEQDEKQRRRRRYDERINRKVMTFS